MADSLVLTCEHGGNDVPAQYRALFRSRAAERALASHRGLDIGSLAAAQSLSARLGAPLFAASVTRLLVDLNRSLNHPRLFSAFARRLDDTQQRDVLAEYYFPYREAVTRAIAGGMRGGRRIVHVSVHSFTPKLGSRRRVADIGLLYDPARLPERELCAGWKAELVAVAGRLCVRRNYPYRGTADGFTTHLRRILPATSYVGIELELNQRLLADRSDTAVEVIAASLRRLLELQPASRTSGSSRAR